MPGLKILITNWTLQGRHGSVMYIRDLALGLLRAGHMPIVYSPELGEVATELQNATVPVVDDLGALGDPPDVIHGNSHCDTMTALLQFPGVPALFVCHAWDMWLAEPPRFPRLRRYVAVDHTCRDWLQWKRGIAGRQIRVLFNAVDLRRFGPRAPLPAHPRRAAVFSNYASEQTFLAPVRDACARVNLPVDVFGAEVGRPCANPEAILGQYDLIFAKGRCALEALAVGSAVVLCDCAGMGPIVSSQNWQQLRDWNFGRRALQDSHCVSKIMGEIARYDAADALEVSRHIRSEAGLESVIASILGLYREIMQEQFCSGDDINLERRSIAEYLHRLYGFSQLQTLQKHATFLAEERRRLQQEVAELRSASPPRQVPPSSPPENPLLPAAKVSHPARPVLCQESGDTNRSIAQRLGKQLRRLPTLARCLRIPVRKRIDSANAETGDHPVTDGRE